MLIFLAKDTFKQFLPQILPGAKTISVSVMNFKPISQLQSEQSQQLNRFFTQCKDVNEYRRVQEKQLQEIK